MELGALLYASRGRGDRCKVMACSELGAIPRRVRCCACGEGACSLRRPDNQPLSSCHPAIQRWEPARESGLAADLEVGSGRVPIHFCGNGCDGFCSYSGSLLEKSPEFRPARLMGRLRSEARSKARSRSARFASQLALVAKVSCRYLCTGGASVVDDLLLPLGVGVDHLEAFGQFVDLVFGRLAVGQHC